MNEALEALHYRYSREQQAADRQSNEEERRRTELLIGLENSMSFAATHAAIVSLKQVDGWSAEEIEALLEAALTNKAAKQRMWAYIKQLTPAAAPL